METLTLYTSSLVERRRKNFPDSSGVIYVVNLGHRLYFGRPLNELRTCDQAVFQQGGVSIHFLRRSVWVAGLGRSSVFV